jgi:hypothetical protein
VTRSRAASLPVETSHEEASEMGYRIMGRAHAAALAAVGRARAVAGERGQGTVEYVALILLVAGVMAGVIAAGHGLKGGNIAQTVVAKLKQAIDGVGARS